MNKGAGLNNTNALKMGGIFRQSIGMFLSNILMLLGGYIFKVYLARKIGASGLGLFAIGETVLMFFVVVFSLEIQQAVFRFIPQFKRLKEIESIRKMSWASTWHVIVFSSIGAIVLFVSRDFWAHSVFQSPELSLVLIFFSVMIPLRSLSALWRMIARGYKSVFSVLIAQSAIAFPLKIIVSVVLIQRGLGIKGWLVGEILFFLVFALLMGRLAIRLTPPEARKPLLTLKNTQEVYSFMLTMFGRTVVGIANSRASIFVTGVFLPVEDVGILSIIITVISFLTLMQSNINGVIAPHLTELNTDGKRDELIEMFFRASRWSLMFSLPMLVIFIVLPGMVLGVFGEVFKRGALALMIFSSGQMINLGTGPIIMLLTMTGHERVVLIGNVMQFLIILLLLMLLLPLWGLEGAAVAQGVGIAMFFVGFYFFAKKKFSIYIYNRKNSFMLMTALVLIPAAIVAKMILENYLGPISQFLAVFILLYGVWAVLAYFAILDLRDKEAISEAVAGGMRKIFST